MGKKRILASVLASIGALASSMAHGKIEKSALSGVSNGTVSSRFLKRGRNLDANAMLNSAMRIFKTEAKVTAGLLTTYGLLEGYNRYGEDIERYGKDIEGRLKKISVHNTKKENSVDNYINVTPERKVNDYNDYIVESEKSEMSNDEYNQNKINNSVNSTRDENSKNAGIYRLEVNGTSFFVAFGKSIDGESDKIYVLFGQNKDEIQKLIKEKKNSNSENKKNMNSPLLKGDRADFIRELNKKVEDMVKDKPDFNRKAIKEEIENKEYIKNTDKRIEYLVDEFITSEIGKILGIAKFDYNFKNDILNCLPDSIRLFDVDIEAAKKEIDDDNFSLFSPDVDIFSISNQELDSSGAAPVTPI